MIAAAALAVSLTAPFWEEPILSVLGIPTSLGRLAQRNDLTARQSELNSMELTQRLTALNDRFNRQQARLEAAGQIHNRTSQLVRALVLLRLSDALGRTAPFTTELSMLRVSDAALADMKPQFELIEPYASVGIPSAAQLRDEFHALYEQVSRAVRGDEGSWLGSLQTWMGNGRPAASDPSLAQLQAAATRIGEGDLAGAMPSMHLLAEAYRTYFANWMQDAEARVAADTIAQHAGDTIAASLQ